jgi:signal transduction histidine kinase
LIVRNLLSRHLYIRIWLAVVSAVVVLALLAAWLWQMDKERDRAQRPGREIVLLNAAGEVLGQAPARPTRGPGSGHGPVEFQVTTRSGETVFVQLPRPPRPTGGGRDSMWMSQTGGFVGMLVLVSLAVALGTYPVVRWLTQRLEALQAGVERWGEGDLAARLPVQGSDEVAFLAQRFNVAAGRVQALVQSHKTLLANASHELRSPLARIRMGLELLGPGDTAKADRQRAEIARNIAELDQLIDEILLASRMDLADKMPLQSEEIDLTGLAAEECARTGAQLQVQAQPTLRGDARLLRRLIRNLLENARRHGAHGQAEASSAVDLWLDVVTVAGVVHARIAVDDRGPGVPPAQREHIFEPFYRLAGASEKDGGVGLGLALVRSIALKHGGVVRCEDRPGGGARFVVDLPLQTA